MNDLKAVLHQYILKSKYKDVKEEQKVGKNRAGVILKELMGDHGTTGAMLARQNTVLKQSINQYLHKPNGISTETFFNLVEGCGYRVRYEYVGGRWANAEFIQSVIDTKEPKGIYFTDEGNMLKLVDNRKGEATVIMFPDRNTMDQWIKMVTAD